MHLNCWYQVGVEWGSVSAGKLYCLNLTSCAQFCKVIIYLERSRHIQLPVIDRTYVNSKAFFSCILYNRGSKV